MLTSHTCPTEVDAPRCPFRAGGVVVVSVVNLHFGSSPSGAVGRVIARSDRAVRMVMAEAPEGKLTCNVHCISLLKEKEGAGGKEVSKIGSQANFKDREW